MADLHLFRQLLPFSKKKGRSLLNILPYHFWGGVNITIYLQLFQNLSYNPLVGFIDGCYVYWLQVNLSGFVGVVSHTLTDGGYRNVHVQGYACPCVACHVGGQWYSSDCSSCCAPPCGMRCMERIPCLSRWVADKVNPWSARRTCRWWLASVSSTRYWYSGGSCDGYNSPNHISGLSSSRTPYLRMPFHADRSWAGTGLVPCQGMILLASPTFLSCEYPLQRWLVWQFSR